jgi:hypothetical protein
VQAETVSFGTSGSEGGLREEVERRRTQVVVRDAVKVQRVDDVVHVAVLCVHTREWTALQADDCPGSQLEGTLLGRTLSLSPHRVWKGRK